MTPITTLSEATKFVLPRLLDTDRRVLLALWRAPNHAATAKELVQRLELKAVVQVNAAMGRIGSQLFALFDGALDISQQQDMGSWSAVATGYRVPGRGFVWKLHAEVVAGLQNWILENACEEPTKALKSSVFTEGRLGSVMLTRHERNPKARDACLRAHGTVCSVCGFESRSVYGADAEVVIQVHHLMPLRTRVGAHAVDPVQDLRPVCPNCHVLIHQTDPPRSIEAVKAMIEAHHGQGSGSSD